MGVLNDAALEARIDALQAQSRAQEPEMAWYYKQRAEKGDLSWDGLDSDATRFMADKLVALEPEKAEYAYLTCRALRATRVVEVGTSFGVSTLYLAAAVRDNGGGTVIGTEYEAPKAAQARANFAAAGLGAYIDLREGDLRETLKDLTGPIDFVLMDIWTEMARPAIELIAPHMRPGAVVLADNTAQFRKNYRFFFEYVDAHGFRRATLPFPGGLEMVVKA